MRKYGLDSMTTEAHKIECEFKHAKETKGTHQYKEIGDNVNIGTLYLKKHAIPDDVPDKIAVAVTW